MPANGTDGAAASGGRDAADARRLRLASWLGAAILAVGALNGLWPWLKRVGFAERARYEAFWEVHTGPEGFTRAPFGIGRRCVTHRRIEDGGAPWAGGGPAARYVTEVTRAQVPVKALKDLLFVALVAASLAAWRTGAAPPPAARAWPAVALAALVAAHAGLSLAQGEAGMTLAGLRSFGFLGLALAAGWASREALERLVPWLVALLALQALLAPVEWLRGVPVQGHVFFLGEYFPRRAAGTFGMPNTLGVFAAAVAALAEGLAAPRRWRLAAWLLAGGVVVAAGSGTGLVLLAATGLAAAAAREGRRRWILLAGLGAACAGAAALLLRTRADVLDSLAGRFGGLATVLSGGAAEVLLGRGLGLGTTAGSRLLAGGAGTDAERLLAGASDSAATAIVLQAGLAGLALYAAALGLAAWRRAELRPLLLCLALASTTLSVTEAFPLNVLLGLALACGAGGGQARRRAAE